MAKFNLKSITLKDFGILIFRIGISYFMIRYHGWGKFQTLISGGEIPFKETILGLSPTIEFYLVVFAEFLVSILMALGLFTRLGAFVLFINMAVASYVMFKMGNSMESPMMYCLSYLALMSIGAGNLSLDYFIRNKK
ncbi:MAG: DoxX family protein [Chitinophagales bacterium]|nr:DoxX family protein [Chitinophagales bacterium]MCZ2394235.1 DoxX family protein [Chitinophagales bacterium]